MTVDDSLWKLQRVVLTKPIPNADQMTSEEFVMS